MDNFNCISHKGRSLVDTMFVPHENIQNIEQFAVLPVTDLCSEFGIHTDRGKLDHSMLCAEFTASFVNHTVITNTPYGNGAKVPGESSGVNWHNVYLRVRCKCDVGIFIVYTVCTFNLLILMFRHGRVM